jgi:hypothetical protein
MHEDDSIVTWNSTDIKMAIKRYFYNLDREDHKEAIMEVEFLRSIHREWSYNPLMRRTPPDGMAIIDDFLKWFESTPFSQHNINDFTIRRLIRD